MITASFLYYPNPYTMAEITLAEYVGFIFSEITRARVMSDNTSKEVAKMYEKDEILKHFSVPRFKIPEMNISIPVLVSGARFTATLELDLDILKFKNFLNGKINQIISSIFIKKSNVWTNIKIDERIFDHIVRPFPRPIPTSKVAVKGRKNTGALKAENDEERILQFYNALKANADKASPDNIIIVHWQEILKANLTERKLMEEYQKQFLQNELFKSSIGEIISFVKQHTIVSNTAIQNLLVNPETAAVKEGTRAETVFTIQAKILEDGFYLKSVMEQGSDHPVQVVEFE